MIRKSEIEAIKLFSETQMGTYINGVIYAIIENGTIIWELSSPHLSITRFKLGNQIDDSIIRTSIQRKERQSTTSYDDATRTNQKIVAIPIVDDGDEECQSVFITVIPQAHPLQDAFKHVAPMITDLFPEGAFVSLTNTKEIMAVQRSEKYGISIEAGFDITQHPAVMEALKTGKRVLADDDTLTYGPPVRVLTAPYFDDFNNKPVGVINVIRLKQSELSLREMSTNLEKQLSEVSLTIQDLAAASNTIYSNEQEINTEIEDITVLADEILGVSKLIESLAHATKMLGLNASIEAARAGDAGRGFGVVATEINKLSEQSNSTVPKIKKLTDDIKAKVEGTKTKSQNSLASSLGQVAGTQQITATIEEIQAVSVELANIASRI